MPHVVRVRGGTRLHSRGAPGTGTNLREEARPPRKVSERERDKLVKSGTHEEVTLENVATAWDAPEREEEEKG